MKWRKAIPITAAALAAACSENTPTATRQLTPKAPSEQLAGGAAFTSVGSNQSVDGGCQNGSGNVNCNIYDKREAVYLNGGPIAAQFNGGGRFFFTVLVPGFQNPAVEQDGTLGNLSDNTPSADKKSDPSSTSLGGGDPMVNCRVFTMDDAGEITYPTGTCATVGVKDFSYHRTSTHPTKGTKEIQLFPYDETTNEGGVYILAICKYDSDPSSPSSCKYDAFKIRTGGVTPPNLILNVDKDIDGSYTRTYKWTIAKSCDNTIQANTSALVTIKCKISGGPADPKYADSDWKVFGKIYITNPSTVDIKFTNVSDDMLVGGDLVHPAVTNCSSMTVPKENGGTVTCDYSYSLSSAPAPGVIFTNTAVVTYDDDGNGETPDGTAESNPYTFQFGDPTTETNKTITISDDKSQTPLGSVTYPSTFSYANFSYTVTASSSACDHTKSTNTATIDETGQSASADTYIDTPCGDLKVRKFYDSNGNGKFDTGEPEFGVTTNLLGWLMTVTGPSNFSQMANTVFTLTGVYTGLYTANEGTLPTGWQVSASYYYAGTGTPGTLYPTLTPSKTQSITLNTTLPSATVVFGNYCTAQEAGGWTMGFWGNNNGNSILAGTNGKWITLLNSGLYGTQGFKLWQASASKNGSIVLQTWAVAGTGTTAINNFNTWLQGAQASSNGSAAYMLSGQFAAALFNITYGGSSVKMNINDNYKIADGSYKSIDWIMTEAAKLLNSGSTADRTQMTTFIGYLNDLNNKKNVIPATPCTGFPSLKP